MAFEILGVRGTSSKMRMRVYYPKTLAAKNLELEILEVGVISSKIKGSVRIILRLREPNFFFEPKNVICIWSRKKVLDLQNYFINIGHILVKPTSYFYKGQLVFQTYQYVLNV